MKQYLELLQDIIDNGVQKGDRTGTGTLSVFARQFRHDLNEGFPLLTTKKLHFKGIANELFWFLNGEALNLQSVHLLLQYFLALGQLPYQSQHCR